MPGEVWRLLLEEGKSLGFLAKEEHELFAEAGAADDNGEEQSYEPSPGEEEEGEAILYDLPDIDVPLPSDGGAIPNRYSDLYLQTAVLKDSLQTSLLRIYRSANSLLQERGVNYLFLAMGLLDWRQPEDAERVFRAPIVLVPVALERTSAKARFKLAALDDEPTINQCLARKLGDYRIRLPDGPESWDDFDIEAYLEKVSQAVAEQDRWSVSRDMYLGFYSFTKYLMYLDLDPERWPAGKGLLDNGLIRGMCGEESAVTGDLSDLPSPAELDEQLRPQDVFQVVDADSSQQAAIHAARKGKNLVIEGPPGTGKSQTITNIIAECLVAGKTVLFVSEKMAALEVVKSRLDEARLGDFCLELHSVKANRKAVTEELGRILARGPLAGHGASDDGKELATLKRRLNSYVKSLHEPFGPSGLSPYQIMGRAALLKDAPDVACQMPGHETWTREEIDQLKELIERFDRQLGVVWPPFNHPWRGAKTTFAGFQTQRSISEALSRLRTGLDETTKAGAAVARALDGAPADTPQGIQVLLGSSKLIIGSPEPPMRLIKENLWGDVSPELKAFLGKVRQHHEGLKWLKGCYAPDSVETIDWVGMRARCHKSWASIARFLRPSYWSDRRQIKRCCVSKYRPDFGQLVGDLNRLAELRSIWQELKDSDEIGRKYFDTFWKGASSSWEKLIQLGNWLLAFRKHVNCGAIGSKGIELAAEGANRDEITTLSGALAEVLNAWEDSWRELVAAVELDEQEAFPQSLSGTPLGELASRLQRMDESIESLQDWAQYQEVLGLCDQSPMHDFMRQSLADQLQPGSLREAMERTFLRLLMDNVLADRSDLRGFNAASHEADQRKYGKLDQDWIGQTPGRVQQVVASSRPSSVANAAGSSQLGILQGEARRKRGGRPIRKLLLDAAAAIQKLKPCFMMSPLSVAQFIDPHGMRFDLVVFDEASQVEPADALGAIARADQLVLVGDPKQLPPTNFFSGLVGAGEPATDEGAAALVDMESILDRGTSVFPTLRLRWHYRSHHESLITFSNSEFYDNDLVVFPSCHTTTDNLGLSLRCFPEDLYDRGKSATNRAQARKVAEAVFEHARGDSGRSLGVGAFSQGQQQAILDEIEKLRREDDSLEWFFDRKKVEPFFVKNLETIQGDERDVIFLSVGYGRQQPGERLSMNFGPLTRDGGYRRLNVLITRAREQCIVFSSILGEDFDLGATRARGVHALKGYLDYARSGELTQIEVGPLDFDSPFEEAVYKVLTARGIRLQTQVGCAGYAIDLAVVDPDRPGRYILGIECDGATYHSSATARDRDRLRQQVLEGLGWRIHRVWSTEWFRQPDSATRKLLDAIERAQTGRMEPTFHKPSRVTQSPLDFPQEPPGDANEPPNGFSAAPYHAYANTATRASEPFYVARTGTLARLVKDIVAFEGPIHRKELIRRVAGVYGFSRVGNKIEKKVNQAIHSAVLHKTIVKQGSFLWPPGVKTPRVRSCDGDPNRAIEMVCEEEIGEAARLLLEKQFGMNLEDLVRQTARFLGYRSTGQRIAAAIAKAIRRAIQDGRIREAGNGLLEAGD